MNPGKPPNPPAEYCFQLIHLTTVAAKMKISLNSITFPDQFSLPSCRQTENLPFSAIASATASCNSPELPMQVVHP